MKTFVAVAFSVLCLAALSAAIADGAESVAPSVYLGEEGFRLAPRTALVIGVDKLSDGSGMGSLRNPRNDADAVAKALRNAGFMVMNLSDNYSSEQMTKQNIKKGIYDFADSLKKNGGVGVVYYSGHGVERNGNMYLFPYDSYVRFDRDFEEELITETFVMDAFAYAKNPLNVFIIDACRDFPTGLQVSTFGSTTVARTKSNGAENVVDAYSALNGMRASDGSDALSPYAKAFLHAIHQPDIGLNDFFGSIGLELADLRKHDANLDVPTEHLIAGRDFVFLPTRVSFNREKDIFNSAITGNGKIRKLLEALRWQYAGGYF